MNKEIIKSEINVNNNKISVMRIENKEYISLTDLARYANPEEPKIPIQTWMRNRDVIAYLGLWEKLNNKNFEGVEFDTFKNAVGSNKFRISPQKWISETNAIGIISKSGNNGETYACSDIALEFVSWLSPEFKLYVIQEFERLKNNEAYQYKADWTASNKCRFSRSYKSMSITKKDMPKPFYMHHNFTPYFPNIFSPRFTKLALN